MTLNNLELTEQLRTLHKNAEMLDRLTREGKEPSLFVALSEIERAAYLAQNILNQLRFPKK